MNFDEQMNDLEKQKASLFQDGKPILGQAEHDGKMAEIDRLANEAYQVADDTLSLELETATQEAKALKAGPSYIDPMSRLTDKELNRAASLLDFARDDLKLQYAQLSQKVSAAIDDGDTVAMSVYAHVLSETSHQVLKQQISDELNPVDRQAAMADLQAAQSKIGKVAGKRSQAKSRLQQFAKERVMVTF